MADNVTAAPGLLLSATPIAYAQSVWGDHEWSGQLIMDVPSR